MFYVTKKIVVNGKVQSFTRTRFVSNTVKQCRSYIKMQRERLKHHKGCTFIFGIVECTLKEELHGFSRSNEAKS